MRKTILTIFAITMLFALVGCQKTEQTEENNSEAKKELVTISDAEDFAWELNNKGGVTITGFADGVEKDTIGKIIVPKTIDGVAVNIIGESAFSSCYSVENLELPRGIKYIEAYAFRNCSSLKYLVIPEGVTNIGDGAFESCSSMTWIEFPDSVEWIGNNVFLFCNSMPKVVASEGSWGERYAQLVNFEVIRSRPEE